MLTKRKRSGRNPEQNRPISLEDAKMKIEGKECKEKIHAYSMWTSSTYKEMCLKGVKIVTRCAIKDRYDC